MADLTVEQAIRAYISLREQIKAVNTAAKDKTAPMTANLNKIEGWIHQEANRLGVTSFKTPAGTAFVKSVTTASVADWGVLLKHILDNKAYGLFTQAVNKTVVADTLEETGNLPPGVNYGKRIGINFRKPEKKV